MEQLSGLDASFLYLETREMHMHVALCAVLDPSTMPGGYRYEAVEDLIRSRLGRLPPFTRRLVADPLGIDHPYWFEDPDFDLIHHMRRVTCPAPGTAKQLGELVGRINSAPLPRDRPLWELWVVEGLENGRFAVVCKVHHSAVDGMMGAGLMVHLLSLQPELAEPTALELPREPVPSEFEMLKTAASHRLRQPQRLFHLAKRTAKAFGEVLDRQRDPQRPSGGIPLTAPRTRLNHAIGARRDVAFSRLPLAGLKRIKKTVPGAKLNDVILAICAGVLRRYLAHHDDLPSQSLVAGCPIATGGRGGGNNVSAMFVPLGTHIDDPEERLRYICAATKGAKANHATWGPHLLRDWAQLAPSSTFDFASDLYSRFKLADHHRPIHNVIVSNVPGPPFTAYLAGAELVSAYPMGPVIDGAGLNLTVMSYRGEVDFGFMVCAQVVPDVWRMAEAVAGAYEELSSLVREEERSQVSQS
ncbi:MAG: wax ester/triacylglycerol synthase family O-acyltransferase [Myxococcota bacterium]